MVLKGKEMNHNIITIIVKMKLIKVLVLIALLATCAPNMVFAQPKPKRDVSKDRIGALNQAGIEKIERESTSKSGIHRKTKRRATKNKQHNRFSHQKQSNTKTEEQKYYEYSDSQGTIQAFEENGDTLQGEAQVQLGLCFYYGEGEPQDYNQAVY